MGERFIVTQKKIHHHQATEHSQGYYVITIMKMAEYITHHHYQNHFIMAKQLEREKEI